MYDIVSDEITTYTDEHTKQESALLAKLRHETVESVPGARMLSGPVVGAFLRMLVQISGAKRVLEIGTYTGYSALSMAEGLPEDGELITFDIDPNVAVVAERYFKESSHGHKIKFILGNAMQKLEELAGTFDLVFVDADKTGYSAYFSAALQLLNPGGVMVFDNVLWSGRVLKPEDEQAKAIDALNKLVVKTPNVDHCLLSVRDGLHVIRKMDN